MNAPKPPLGRIPDKFDFDPRTFLTPEQHLEHARRLVASMEIMADSFRQLDESRGGTCTMQDIQVRHMGVDTIAKRIHAHLDLARAIKESESWGS